MAWSIFREGGGDQVAVGWAKQLLGLLGAPDTPGNEQFIYQWERSEGGGGKYNPLNQGPVQGKPYLTTTGQQYGGGAADFASWDAGLQGAVDFLHYPQYKGVLQGLMADNPSAARQALWSSPWAASHYGYGSNWANVALPNGVAVLPATGNGVSGTDVSLVGQKDDTCALGFSLPGGIGQQCFLSKANVRSMIGLLLMGSAVLVGLTGALYLVIHGITNTKAGQTGMQAVQFLPGGKVATNLVKSGAKKKATIPQRATKPQVEGEAS